LIARIAPLNPQSAIRNPRSAIRNPQSAIRNPQSAVAKMTDWKSLVRARIGPLPVDPAREADIVDELAQHVAQHHADLVASGVSDADARAIALAPLGSPPEGGHYVRPEGGHDLRPESGHDGRKAGAEIARADRPRDVAPVPPPAAGSLAGTIARDVRYAVRLLRRAPGFAAAAIVTLALGIGANTAIFSVVRAVVLRPPPYRDPARLVTFLNSRSGRPGSLTSSSQPDYLDWERQLTSFERLGLHSGWTFNITGLELPERVYGARVSGSLFTMLGTPPLVGRVIEMDDDRPGTPEVVVLGYRVWQRLFAGDPSVIGRPVMMEGRPHIVIGVMPPRFRFPTDDIELWAAIKDNMTGMPRVSRFMVAVGRLKPHVTLATAQAEIDALSAQLEAAYPDSNKGWRVRLRRLHDAVVGDTRPALLALVGAVGLVLLIACANVSNLLLTRATSRRRETAIRLALGASRTRVIGQWLTENLVLSLAGGACGVALAYGAVRLVVAFGPPDVPRLDETTVDGWALTFTFVITVAAGAIPALGPALRALRVSPQAALKDGAGGYSSAGRGRTGAVLIVGEVALAMALAVAGGLLLKSFARLTSVTPGFDADRVLSFKVFLTPPRYRTVASGKQYVRNALDRLAALPGVEAVAAVSQLPLGDPSSTQLFDIEGHVTAPGERPAAGYRAVSANYFSTLRIPIARGRALADDDRENSPFVVVINEAAARRFWPNEDPLGQRITWATGIPAFDRAALTVVGIAADIKSNGLDKPESPAIYAPYTQRAFPWLRWNSFVVRTNGEPQSYARLIREELTKVDPLQPTYQMASLDEVIAQSVAARRFHTWLIDLFAALALALCAVGVYGTINYWVSDRAREIGVRMALGATRRGIRLMIVARATGFTAIGVLAGAALSLVTSRALSTLLFDVQPFDPSTLVAVSALVLFTGAAAAYVPARRASTLDPLTVIRGE
jgi:putative ABC transport system permease protein